MKGSGEREEDSWRKEDSCWEKGDGRPVLRGQDGREMKVGVEGTELGEDLR